MTRAMLYLRLLLVAAATVVGAASHWWLVSSQPDRHDIRALRQQVGLLPVSIGSWRMIESHELAAPVRSMLACDVFASRTYRHRETGARVNIAVIIGPSGPTAAHQPAVCYAARYERLEPERLDLSRLCDGGQSGLLWMQRMTAQDAGQLCVIYGWNAGAGWRAPQHARLELARHPRLAKLQISAAARNVAHAQQTCQAFLQEALPHLDQHVGQPLDQCNGRS